MQIPLYLPISELKKRVHACGCMCKYSWGVHACGCMYKYSCQYKHPEQQAELLPVKGTCSFILHCLAPLSCPSGAPLPLILAGAHHQRNLVNTKKPPRCPKKPPVLAQNVPKHPPTKMYQKNPKMYQKPPQGVFWHIFVGCTGFFWYIFGGFLVNLFWVF